MQKLYSGFISGTLNCFIGKYIIDFLYSLLFVTLNTDFKGEKWKIVKEIVYK